MAEQTPTISERELQTLDTFAQRNLQEAEASEMLEAAPPYLQRGGIYLLSGITLVCLSLLYFGQVHSVVTAPGVIVPQGESIPVQLLESGIAAEVLAQPGDRLPAGAPILRIERNRSGLSLAALERQAALQAQQFAALRADSAALAGILAAPEATLRRSVPRLQTSQGLQLVSSLRAAYLELQRSRDVDARQSETRQAHARQEIELARQRLALMEENRTSAAERLRQAEVELQEFRRLADEGYFSSQEMRAEEERFRQQQERLDAMDLDISNERLRISDLESRRAAETLDSEQRRGQTRLNYDQNLAQFRQGTQNLQAEMRRLAAELQNTRDEILVMREQMRTVTVTMPVAGTIAEMHVANAGELVSTGQVVAVVVPEGMPLVIRASVPNKDIGFVAEALPARIKVDAFPFEQFGTVPGRVARVFPNTGQSQNFTILVELLEEHIRVGDQAHALFPGLAVKVEVLTQKQRLYTLLLSGGEGKQDAAP